MTYSHHEREAAEALAVHIPDVVKLLCLVAGVHKAILKQRYCFSKSFSSNELW